jgi:hypothetical protein
MPRVSLFYGIAIWMYYRDHAPPHFHAEYADQEALIAIDSGSVIEGRLPRRALRMVRQWATLHHDELLENWNLARAQLPLHDIDPLE